MTKADADVLAILERGDGQYGISRNEIERALFAGIDPSPRLRRLQAAGWAWSRKRRVQKAKAWGITEAGREALSAYRLAQ